MGISHTNIKLHTVPPLSTHARHSQINLAVIFRAKPIHVGQYTIYKNHMQDAHIPLPHTYNGSIMHVGIRLLAGENLPKDNAKGEDINLSMIKKQKKKQRKINSRNKSGLSLP